MKGERKMRKYAALIIAVLTVITVFSAMNLASAQQPEIKEKGVYTVTKTITVPLSDIKKVSGPSGSYVIAKGLRLTGIPGAPAIPVKNIKITLPKDAKVISVQVSKGNAVSYGYAKITPARAPVLKDGYKIPQKFSPPATSKIYSMDKFYPQKDMRYNVGRAFDATNVYVHLFPIKYNPVTGKVIVNPTMKVTVTYTINNVRAGSAPIDVPNIIITAPELKAQAQRLADFHNSTGMTSWVVTTTWIASHFQPAGNPPINGYGNATTDPYGILGGYSLPLNKNMIIGYNYTLARKIVAFLQNESKGNNVFYVTIFGNARMVPPSYYYVDQQFYIFAYYGLGDYYDAWIPTDAMYASPNYNKTHFDYTPTFAVGRLPVNNMTAKNVVDNIIHYANTKKKGIQNVTLSGGQVFETPYFLGETGVLEPINYGWMDGTNITEYFHTLRNYTYNNFIKMMYNSDLILEITHGSGFSFWHHNDEVSAWDFPMNGSYGSQPIYISGSCLNGAWDEEMFPAYSMSAGINGGTSIAEKMLFSPRGIIAYFGADREALGSTYAYYDNGTLVAPNDFSDLMTEDGTIAGYYIGTHYYGYATLGLMEYYAHVMYNQWVPYLPMKDPMEDGLNDNPWARSYFEYTLLGDPALQVAGSGPNNPSYSQPKVTIPNAVYDSGDMPVITSGMPVSVKISTTSPKVKAELLYLEMDYGKGYGGATYPTYYDFVLGSTELSPVSSNNGVNNFTYTFTPKETGIYILSVYGEDGKNTRFYMDCGIPTPPAIHLQLKEKKFMHMNYDKLSSQTKASAPDVQVITLLDYGNLEYGKNTNVTAVVYNAGTATATNVKVQFYLENYTLVFQSGNLSHPLVWLGNATVNTIAPGQTVYVTIPWKSVNLWAINHSWDPYNSSARWQYIVANAQVSGDSNPANNANWALLHVNLKLDVWAQKVFVEKDPVLNQPNNITFEVTNVGTTYTSNSTIYVLDMDDYSIIAALNNVKILPGQTEFFTVPWTPQNPGDDSVAVYIVTPGDNNTRNDVGFYYTNGYDSVTNFVVRTYDVGIVSASAKSTNNGSKVGVEIYNYGPLTSNNVTIYAYAYSDVKTIDVESPHPYPNNFNETWVINTPAGAGGIALHFGYLKVEPGYDYVYIYNETHKLVAQYTGFHYNMWTNYIPGSKVYVQLVSDEYVHYAGFQIDALATQYTYLGNVSFNPVNAYKFAEKTFNTSINVSNTAAIRFIAATPGEEATLSTGGSANNQYYLITQKVEIQAVSPVNITNNRQPTITLKYALPSGINYNYTKVYIDGIKVPAYRTEITGSNYGYIKADVPFMLADGTHEAKVYTVAQNSTGYYTNWTFTVDAIAPQLTITSPSNGNKAITYESTLWINGTTDPGASVTVNGVAVTVDENGNFAYKATLVEGLNVFTVEAKDSAGNVATEKVTALYLPDLPQLWSKINDMYAEINNMSSEIKTLQSQVSTMQGQIAQLSTQLQELKKALDENVTALNKAIAEMNNKTIKMIQDNITAINEKLKTTNNEISSVKSKNKAQDGAIGTSSMMGIVGIILALIAMIMAAIAMMKKGNGKSGSATKTESFEESEEPEEEEEEEGLEEI